MNKKTSLIALVMALLVLPAALMAQNNQFFIDGQLRVRGEYRASSTTNNNVSVGSFINERARIGLGYENEWLTLKFSGQHCGVWGQTAQNPVNSGDFNISEAWAQLKMGSNFYTKLGRQALVYDDERLLGGLDWHIAGRSHDVIKFGFVSTEKTHQLDLMLAYNQNGMKQTGGNYFAPGGQPYKTMETLWYHLGTKGNCPFGMSLLFMNLGFENGTELEPSSRYMQTFGTYLTLKPGNLSLEGTFYFQTAQNKLANVNTSAWMAALKASYKFCDAFSAAAGLDWLSGNQLDSRKVGFNPLYGTHHKFYGIIDYYYVNTTPVFGLIDPYLNASVNASKSVNLQLTYHAFFNDTDGGLLGSKILAKSYAASEVDFQLTWKARKYVTLMGGWSGIFRSENNLSTVCKKQNWCWLQLNINPRMFFTKW